MDPLKLNRELLTYICACSAPRGTRLYIRVCYQASAVVLIIFLIFGCVSSIVYIIEYLKTDLQSALYAIFQVAAEFSAFYTMIMVCMNPNSTLTVFLKLNHIREKGK